MQSLNQSSESLRIYGIGKMITTIPSTMINFVPNNCVMLINKSGGDIDHAVNVTQITTQKKKHYFSYADYSNSGKGGGTARESDLVCIFPFYTGPSN